MPQQRRTGSHDRQPIEASLQAAASYRLGEPIDVTFTVRNTSSQTYQVLTWGTPLEHDVTDFLTVERDGEALAYDGRIVKRGDPARFELRADRARRQGRSEGRHLAVLSHRPAGRLHRNDQGRPPRRVCRRGQLQAGAAATGSARTPSAAAGLGHLQGRPRRRGPQDGRRGRARNGEARQGRWRARQGEGPGLQRRHHPGPGRRGRRPRQRPILRGPRRPAAEHRDGEHEQPLPGLVRGVRPRPLRHGDRSLRRHQQRAQHESVTYDFSGTDCDSDVFAWTNKGSRTVHLCSLYISAPQIGTDCKFGTLVHEWSHAVSSTDDYAYGETNAGNLANTDPGKAIDNADNHEYFTEHLAQSDFGKSLTYITDRGQFGRDEVDARLASASPSFVERAFYVHADGFWPDKLGITATSLGTSPTVKPTLSMSPSISGMTVEVAALEAEDTSLPVGPQRFTWVLRVKFTSSSGFPNVANTEQIVTLTAALAGMTASAQIRLLKEASPYELDGSTSWLSTDVRVFQSRRTPAGSVPRWATAPPTRRPTSSRSSRIPPRATTAASRSTRSRPMSRPAPSSSHRRSTTPRLQLRGRQGPLRGHVLDLERARVLPAVPGVLDVDGVLARDDVQPLYPGNEGD